MSRNDYENVTEEGKWIVIGEPTEMKEDQEVVVFACGVIVGKALKAAGALLCGTFGISRGDSREYCKGH